MTLLHDHDEVVQGQGQKVRHREVHAVTDTVILDPEADNAVQTDGGSSVDAEIPLAEAIRAGTAEEQFAAAEGRDDEASEPAEDPAEESQEDPAAEATESD